MSLMTRFAIGMSCLLALPALAPAQEVTCRNAALSDAGSAFAWVDSGIIPERSELFSLIVTLPSWARVPATVEVGRADQWWRARVRLRDDLLKGVMQVRTVDDAPEWLKRADSVDVCLVLRGARSQRLVRLPRVRMLRTS
jgi:hypothetical protein